MRTYCVVVPQFFAVTLSRVGPFFFCSPRPVAWTNLASWPPHPAVDISCTVSAPTRQGGANYGRHRADVACRRLPLTCLAKVRARPPPRGRHRAAHYTLQNSNQSLR